MWIEDLVIYELSCQKPTTIAELVEQNENLYNRICEIVDNKVNKNGCDCGSH